MKNIHQDKTQNINFICLWGALLVATALLLGLNGCVLENEVVGDMEIEGILDPPPESLMSVAELADVSAAGEVVDVHELADVNEAQPVISGCASSFDACFVQCYGQCPNWQWCGIDCEYDWCFLCQ